MKVILLFPLLAGLFSVSALSAQITVSGIDCVFADTWPVDDQYTADDVTIVCPTINSSDLSATATTICEGDNTVDLTVSNLANMAMVDNMEADFGISFVAFAAQTSTPYSNGTLLGTVAPDGMSATLEDVNFPASATYIYAILDQAPTSDVNCRPFAELAITINPAVVDASGPTDNFYCGADPVTPLSVDDPGAGFEIDWYSVTSGGSKITNATFGGTRNEQITLGPTSAPNEGASITLYAEVRNTTTACVSENRVAVTLNHYAALTANLQSVVGCFTDVLNYDLTAFDAAVTPGATIRWYQGDPRTDGIEFATPNNVNLNKAEPTSVGLMFQGNSVGYESGTPQGLYSESEDANGCKVVQQHTLVLFDCGITITRNPDDPEIADPCKCKDNATTDENGQFDELVTVFAPAGQTWTVMSVNGLFNTSSAAPPAVPIDNLLGMTITEVPDPDEPLLATYALYGIHVDAIGYSILVSNGTTELSIGNRCFYPEISIDNLKEQYCKTAPSVTITGTTLLGDATNTAANGTNTFKLYSENDETLIQTETDGDIDLDFATLGAGDYRLVFIFVANEDDPDASHAGCARTIEKIFTIKDVDCGGDAFPWNGN